MLDYFKLLTSGAPLLGLAKSTILLSVNLCYRIILIFKVVSMGNLHIVTVIKGTTVEPVYNGPVYSGHPVYNGH